MMESMDSLKVSRMSVPEGSKSAPRARQGAEQSLEADRQVTSAKPQQLEAMETRDVEALAKELNKALEDVDSNVSVSVDDTTGMVIVRIQDSTTGEIMKQIPPQQLLDADVSMDKIIGLLVDDMA